MQSAGERINVLGVLKMRGGHDTLHHSELATSKLAADVV